MQIIGKLLEKLTFCKNDRKIDILVKNGKSAMENSEKYENWRKMLFLTKSCKKFKKNTNLVEN